MCGIAGICNLCDPRPISLDKIAQMVAIQQHRGPDESGIYIDDWVGLGQARLSIIDLSGGSQPIHNEDRTLWIVYNGEVFNYPELRRDLVQNGHHFYTTSDTEVLLHLFEQKGPACLKDLNGQFAFAVWDTKKKELFLARDRIGIRPLHYTIHRDRLVFASEIKAIFQDPDIERSLDPIALDEIFTFWTTLSGRTAFEGVKELPPGHYMRLSQGHVQVERYWDIPFCKTGEQVTDSIEDVVENVGALLDDAIRIRLRADVPVGCYLSGGLDSSGLTAKVVRDFDSDVKTFGIRFEEKDFDEGDHQQLMVSHLNVNHREILATNQKIGCAFADVIWHCEKPILRTAPVPLFLLSALVNESGLKVVLTGEGADEFFGGYNIFREAKVRRFWSRSPQSASRPKLLEHLYPYIFKNPRLKPTLQSFFARGLDQPEDPFFSHMIRWANTSKIKSFFSDDMKAQIGSYCGIEQLRGSLPEGYDTWDYFSKAQYLESSIFLSDYLLSSQGDRMAMAHSLEIRLPYLDWRIMEYMAKVPSKWKVLGLNEKHLLKKVFAGILPEKILNRSKHPYRAPISQSLLMQEDSYINSLLSAEALDASGIFNGPKVENLIRKLRRTADVGEIDSMALTGIVSAQIMYDRFVGGSEKISASPAKVDLLFDYRISGQPCHGRKGQ